MTRYGFRQAIGAFFLADSDVLRGLLPSGLQPLEARPGLGVLAVTAFDFTESEVGAYGELVMSVLVPPFANRGADLPEAATFPFALGTTTPASRAHAAERWYLPEHPGCFDIAFSGDADTRRVQVTEAGAPVLDLVVGRRSAGVRTRLYQCFSARDGHVHRVDLQIRSNVNEHEEESGRLVLHPHVLCDRVAGALFDEVPIREQSSDSGQQTFAELVSHDKVSA